MTTDYPIDKFKPIEQPLDAHTQKGKIKGENVTEIDQTSKAAKKTSEKVKNVIPSSLPQTDSFVKKASLPKREFIRPSSMAKKELPTIGENTSTSNVKKEDSPTELLLRLKEHLQKDISSDSIGKIAEIVKKLPLDILRTDPFLDEVWKKCHNFFAEQLDSRTISENMFIERLTGKKKTGAAPADYLKAATEAQANISSAVTVLSRMDPSIFRKEQARERLTAYEFGNKLLHVFGGKYSNLTTSAAAQKLVKEGQFLFYYNKLEGKEFLSIKTETGVQHIPLSSPELYQYAAQLKKENHVTQTTELPEWWDKTKDSHFSSLSRENAEKLLEKNGQFLIRYSSNAGGDVLSVKWNDKFQHIPLSDSELSQCVAQLKKENHVIPTTKLPEWWDRTKDSHFSSLSRENAEKLLEKNGQFLIRYSSNAGGDVLSVKWNDKFQHIPLSEPKLPKWLAVLNEVDIIQPPST